MDKDTYKLLKWFYSNKVISVHSVIQDERLHYLMKNNFVENNSCNTQDEYGEPIYDSYKITITGNAYVEQKRHNFWGFILPYAITTLLAVASIIAQLV
jgi:hypothetical protein